MLPYLPTSQAAYDAMMDEMAAPLATHDDAMREYARNVGFDPVHADSAWILTNYDVWVPNPHYRGPKQRHPEDYDPADLYEALADQPRELAADKPLTVVPYDSTDDDLPF